MAASREVDKLQRDIDAYCSKLYKTSPDDPGYQRLPKCWNPKDRSKALKLSHFSLTVSYVGGYSDRLDSAVSHDPGAVRSDVPIPLSTGIYYFEITIASKGNNGWSVSIGVQQRGSSLSKHIGMEHTSFGFHNDGSLYHWSASSVKLGPRSVENDTLGCGVDFISRCLFFTRNGVFLGKAFEGKIPANPGARLYPAVGIQGRGARVTTNFGQRPFCYAFDSHIKRERIAQENYLVDRMCKEEFAGPKMKDLVSGYLVHHGYIATAQSFSRWSALPITNVNNQVESTVVRPSTHSSSAPCLETADDPSQETCLASDSKEPYSDRVTTHNLPSVPRRHSDGFFTHSVTTTAHLPGFASMLHRRRLRALCRRCQYGRAAATLHRLYPQVLERCPELLVQLRCRQLIEMMHRHALRRGRGPEQNAQGQHASQCSVAPAKVQRLSDSQHVRSACCFADKSSFVPTPHSEESESHANGTSTGQMDVDPDTSQNSSSYPNDIDLSLPIPEDVDDSGDPNEDDDEYDDFCIDEYTGACGLKDADPAVVSIGLSDNRLTTHQMDVDSEPARPDVKAPLAANVGEVDNDEIPCLLRHVQFGRSLVNLVRHVRAKTGGLSFETEKLLQQSVSLLAYTSPASPDCPLRGLLDPSWRDAVANVVNSAVLKAHDLPVQPALEQGLLALQRCLKDPQFVEGQTLGHFLLYHLTPSQLAQMEQENLQKDAISRLKQACQGDSHPSDEDRLPASFPGAGRNATVNGHPTGRRRGRYGEGSSEMRHDVDDSEEYASALDDVFKDEGHADDGHGQDEEEQEDNVRIDACRPDDESTNEDDDDDDERDADPASDIRRRSRDVVSSASPSNPSLPPGSGGSGCDPSVGGRTHANIYRVRQFSTLRSSFTQSPVVATGRPSRTVFARCVPTLILEPARTDLVVTNNVPTHHRPVNRRVSVDSTPTLGRVGGSPYTESEIPPNQYLDSSFSGLLSLSYPQHAEFLSAMNDALKAYAGSLLVTETDLSGPSSSNVPGSRHVRDESSRDATTDGECSDGHLDRSNLRDEGAP